MSVWKDITLVRFIMNKMDTDVLETVTHLKEIEIKISVVSPLK